MILIFGGAYQGKLAYAMERFNAAEGDVYRCGDDARVPGGKKIICNLEKWILSLVRAEADTEEAMRRFIDANGDAVVICDDISSGVVPSDPLLRKWREAVGRSLALLSRGSDEVIRLFCAIPARIK